MSEGEFTFDLDKVTVGDIVDIEETVGMPWDDIVDMDTPPTKVVLAMLWVVRRRQDPSFTLDDARQLPLSEVQSLSVGSDPTGAAG